jgi:asparagine synthase (glutamine-hydrolysing)
MEITERIGSAMAAAQLSALAKSVKRDQLTYLSPQKMLRIERALRGLAGAEVPGEFLEFGLALGGSGILIADEARKQKRNFIGFDVFAMIPAPTSAKDDEKSRARYQTIAAGKSKGIDGDDYYGYRTDLYGDVVRAFEAHGLPVDGEKVTLMKGLFEETWPLRKAAPIAFAHVDCDWYDPVKFCLAAVADQMQPRGVIVIDDYHDYGGCRAAVDEFLTSRGDFTFSDGNNPILTKS